MRPMALARSGQTLNPALFIQINFNEYYNTSLIYHLLSMSLNVTHGNTISETKKIFCAYHRTEFLTNFCLEKECLMPLCPSCVAEHTEEHYQASQKPTYINLNEALHEVKQKCFSHIVGLEQCSKKNDDLIRYRMNLAEDIHAQLTHCKQEIYAKIEHVFQKYQTKLIKEIEQHYQSSLVYDSEQAEIIKEYVAEQIQLLYDKIGLLKSDQCLAALIRFYDSEHQDYEDGLKDVYDYIGKHRKVGIAEIKLNTEVLNEKFDNLCADLLTLSYTQEDDREQSKQNIKNSKMKKVPLAVMTPKTSKQPVQSTIRNRTPIGNFNSRSYKNTGNQY